jgi:hypothetical protein
VIKRYCKWFCTRVFVCAARCNSKWLRGLRKR